jgi:hypothetical protein
MLQCAPREPRRDWRWWFQNLSSQPRARGASLGAGAQAALQQLGAAHGGAGLAGERGTRIIVAATTDAGRRLSPAYNVATQVVARPHAMGSA